MTQRLAKAMLEMDVAIIGMRDHCKLSHDISLEEALERSELRKYLTKRLNDADQEFMNALREEANNA